MPLNKQNSFNAIMDIAREIERQDPRGLIQFVRLCGLTILGDVLAWRIRSRRTWNPRMLRPESFFPPVEPITRDGKSFVQLCPELRQKRTVRLGRDLVFTSPWDRGRLASSIANIGPNRGWRRWKYDPSNHHVEVWLPIGVAWVTNGFHSTTAGIIRGEGELPAEHVRDITGLYPHVSCDGAAFYRKSNGSKIADVEYPQFAAIFEIGRLLVKHKLGTQTR